MSKLKDLTGMKFGRLTVIERAENDKLGKARWLCKCDCGNETVVGGAFLRLGQSTSCGCLRKETGNHRTHGMKGTSVYHSWCAMKQRCLNPNTKKFKRYGGRGITIYPDWVDDFQAFYDYVSKLEHFGKEGYTLDRIDNNGNYEPNNLRWADNKTQARNRRSNIIVEYNGKAMTLTESAESSGIAFSTLLTRYRAGDREDRLFRPVKQSSFRKSS